MLKANKRWMLFFCFSTKSGFIYLFIYGKLFNFENKIGTWLPKAGHEESEKSWLCQNCEKLENFPIEPALGMYPVNFKSKTTKGCSVQDSALQGLH